ncbi:MAG TPA: hypothetical protein VG275_05140 [Solirubrobacteraceae bacterium]|jgi:cell division protease FtsH|nr:hypothetical protein [Solirubrobacteraceae bacterium]
MDTTSPPNTPNRTGGWLRRRNRGLLIFVALLIALNVGSARLLSPVGPPRVPIPFTPSFLTQVQAGHVSSIATRGDTIEGTFKATQRLPTGTASSTPTTLFSTEVPVFWNTNQLSALLQARGVRINAQSTAPTASVTAQLLLGFGPTLLIVGLFIFVARRAARAAAGSAASAGSAGSGARRRAASIPIGSR